jgi:myo-inositol 2-dehydrogenase / D-chiro-inositol 1-dehydrogenase
VATPHATASEAHNRLMLTKALDLSAKLKKAVPLPLEPERGAQKQRKTA